MQIRRARPDDALALGGIYVQAWRQAFVQILPREYLDALDAHSEAASWKTLLDGDRWPKAGALVIEAGQDLVAFSGFGPAEGSPDTAELQTLYALPEVWGTGVGRRLMAATIQILRQAKYQHAVLWVLEANTRARTFYHAAGWQPDRTIVDDATTGVRLPKLRYYRSLN
jgi:GNAT superfamily N-acetyltransferase